MVHIDMNKPATGGYEPTPGIDLWEVRKVEATKSKNTQMPMLKLEFARDSNPDDRLYDNLMLDGAGWGIGKSKLEALLEPGFTGDLDPLSLVHVKLWISTSVESYTNKHSKQRKKLVVNIDDLKHSGYQRIEDVPPGQVAPEEPDEVPF